MPVARKTKAGTWRCQAFDRVEIIEGKKKYFHKSFTAKTKYEAERLAREFMENRGKISCELSLSDATDKYIEIKKNTLSPSTIAGYRLIQKNHFGNLSGKKLAAITSEDLQVQINSLAKDHSEKTCRNMICLFSAVQKTFIPEKRFFVSVPVRSGPEYYTPTDDDIEKLLENVKSPDLKKAILLSAFGTMRRSEICGLKYSDIEGNIITVRRAKVRDETGKWVIKEYPKNPTSHRKIQYPDFVINQVFDGRKPEDIYIIKVNPGSITDLFGRAVKKAGVHHFRFHDLRAYSASIAHAIGIPDVYIMERGGWRTDGTLKKIYRRSMSDKSKEMTDKINSYYSDRFSGN